MIVGFDFDGTLVTSWTADPLPNVRERLADLPTGTRTFVATNQAGPVWRRMTGETKYPSCDDVAERIIAGLAALDWRPDVLLLAVCAETEPDHIWHVAAREMMAPLYEALRHVTACYVSALSIDRKPRPGMLLDAATHFVRAASEMRYIGDMDTDMQAAYAAGCRYQDAADWRERGLL